MNQTVQDLYLLYLIQFSNLGWLALFHEIRNKTGTEIALLNSTGSFLVSDGLIGFLDRYLIE